MKCPQPFLQQAKRKVVAGVKQEVWAMQADNVVMLRQRERVHQDAEPIATIYRNLGTTSAEQVVTRALAELALTMAGLANQVRSHELSDLSRQLRRLQRMSENLGMISLGLVAADARSCLESADSTSFAAVWARLMRIAERSLAPDKDLLDQSRL
jgi:hypothetical protein